MLEIAIIVTRIYKNIDIIDTKQSSTLLPEAYSIGFITTYM